MKKFYSIFMSIVFVLGMMSTGLVGKNNKVEAASTTERFTEVDVHALDFGGKLTDFTPVNDTYNIEAGTFEANHPLEKKTGITGAYFVAVKKGDKTGILDDENKIDPAKINAYKAAHADETVVMKSGDKTTMRLKDGEWNIYFVKSLSTIDNSDGKLFSEYKPATIPLTLPFVGKSGYASKIHVFTKFYLDKPTVSKSSLSKQDTSDATGVLVEREAGDFKEEKQEWLITVTVPSDIMDYTTFKVEDTLNEKLTYFTDGNKVADSVEVKYVNADTEKFNYAGASLYPGANYNVSVDSNNKITIDFLKTTPTSGDPKETLGNIAGKKLYIKLSTKIKSGETLDKNKSITNTAKVVYKNDSSEDEKEVTPDGNDPKVVNGSHLFKKVDSESRDPLSGAKFVLRKTVDNVDLYLKKITDDGYEWVKAGEDDDLTKTSGVAKFAESKGLEVYESSSKEKDKGEFTVEGLAPGTYEVVEIVAPDGYALPEEIKATSFTIAENTGTGETTEIENNTKLAIPLTGGIGTIIFTVAGLTLITVSIIAIKRRRESEE